MANKNLREWFQATSENIELGEGFNIEDIPEVELPENFNDDFHAKYLTVTAAKNNSELMGHFKGKYLSSTDLKIKNGFIANGGTEDEFNELKAQEPDTLKLVDLIFDKVKSSKSPENPAKDNKEFEKYKTETAKQIADLLAEKEGFSGKLDSISSEKDAYWVGKLKHANINSRLMGNTYNNGMDKADAIYLTQRKIEDSNFILKYDENLQEKVYDKANPEMEAIVDGKSVDWNFVLDKYSQPYTAKNDQGTTEKPQVRQMTVASASSDEDGRYTPGHANYGK